MVRVRLPYSEARESDFTRLYEAMSAEYFNAAKGFISSVDKNIRCFLEVDFEKSEDKKYVKIKRTSRLRVGKETIKVKTFNDFFYKDSLKIKR